MNSGLQIYNEQNNWHSAGVELRIQSQARHVIYTIGIYAYNTTQKAAARCLSHLAANLTGYYLHLVVLTPPYDLRVMSSRLPKSTSKISSNFA